MKQLKVLTVTLAVVVPVSLEAQINQYRFSGTVQQNQQAIDFFAEELPLSDSTIRFGDTITGDIWVVTGSRGHRVTEGHWIKGVEFFPGRNRRYQHSVLDAELQINGEPFLASDHVLDTYVFDNVFSPSSGVQFPLGEERADAVIFGSSLGVIHGDPASYFAAGLPLVGDPEERYMFMLNFTDTSARALRAPRYPDVLDLTQYDLAKGFILPWSENEWGVDYGAMFQIDSFELVATHVPPVIEYVRSNETLKAGDSTRLHVITARGNTGVEVRWSVNGVDLPFADRSSLDLENLQPSDTGTYRVTAWNSVGTTNVVTSRVLVEGTEHRIEPLAVTGWNADVILLTDEELDQQDSFDGDSAYWFAADVPESPDGSHWLAAELLERTDGFPITRQFTSAVNEEVRYELQPYDDRNVLLLSESEPSGMLTLRQPSTMTTLALIAASVGGNDAETGMLSLHFADGSVSEEIPFYASDWWTTPERSGGAAIAGLGRLNRGEGNELEYESPNGYGFGLYETEIDLVSLGLANRMIQSVQFHKPASSSVTGVFALSAQFAEIRQGVHLSWPSEGKQDLIEFAEAPDGPWFPLMNEVKTAEGRDYVPIDFARMPRFSRSLVRRFVDDLSVHFDFSVDGRDRLGRGDRISFGSFGEVFDGTQFIAEGRGDLGGKSDNNATRLSSLTYLRYTLGLDFSASDVPAFGQQMIVNGGDRNAWIRFFIDNGNLAFSFDDGQFVEVFEDARVLPNQWYRILCGVDVRTGFVNVVFDGKPLLRLDLGKDYGYQKAPSSVHNEWRSLHFSGMNGEMASFGGNIDNLIVFRKGYSIEELIEIHQALEPALLVFETKAPNALGEWASVGMNLSWEGNLEGFELQRSDSTSGPWTPVEPLSEHFNERFLYPMVTDGEMGIFRLWRAR